MWMKHQVLPPRVQDTNGSALYCVMTVTKSLQRIPGSGEQKVVKTFTAGDANFVEYLRKCKNNMEMPHVQNRVETIFGPESLLYTLTFGTMAVPATIIADLFFPTAIATQDMAAQSRGSAFSQRIKYVQLICIRVVTISKLATETPDDVGYFVLCARHNLYL